MGALAVGDAVASIDGVPSIVTGVFPQGERAGLSRHVLRRAQSREALRRAPVARALSRLAGAARAFARRKSRAMLACVATAGASGSTCRRRFRTADDALPIDPWLLGALLGDGSICRQQHPLLDRRRREMLVAHARAFAGRRCDVRVARAAPTIASCNAAARTTLGVAGVQPESAHGGAARAWTARPVSAREIHPARLPVGAAAGRASTSCAASSTRDGWVERWGTVRFLHDAASGSRDDVVELVRSLGGVVHAGAQAHLVFATRARREPVATCIRRSPSPIPSRARSSCSPTSNCARLAASVRATQADLRLASCRRAALPTQCIAVVASVAPLRHRRLRRHAQHGARAQHRRARGDRPQAAGRRVLDGNGRVAARDAHDRLGRPARPAQAAHRAPRARRLGEAVDARSVACPKRRCSSTRRRRSTPSRCARARAGCRSSTASSAS